MIYEHVAMLFSLINYSQEIIYHSFSNENDDYIKTIFIFINIVIFGYENKLNRNFRLIVTKHLETFSLIKSRSVALAIKLPNLTSIFFLHEKSNKNLLDPHLDN